MSPAGRSSSARVAVAIAVAGVAVMLASSVPPPSRVFSDRDAGDISRYFHDAERTYGGQVPYRDFELEYPPGFLPAVLAPGPADHGYYDRFRALMLVLDAAAVALLVIALVLAGADATALAGGVLVLATLPLSLHPDLVFERYDLWPTVLLLLGLVGLLSGRRVLGLAALGVGGAAKLFPLALVPLAILTCRGRAHLRRDLTVVAVAALVPILPFAVMAPRGVGHFGKLTVLRRLHAESLGGSLLLVVHRLGGYKPTVFLSSAGSWDLAGPAAQVVAILSTLLELVALLAVWHLFARTNRTRRDLLLAAAAAIVGLVAFGKVLSPQYLVWVAAVVPLALGRSRLFALAATVAAALVTRYVYLYRYGDLLRAGNASWIMFARNVILVALFCSLVIELARSARSVSPFAGSEGRSSFRRLRAPRAS